jgi:hypothetical protein
MPRGVEARKGARRSRLQEQARSERTRSRGSGPTVHRETSAQAGISRAKDLEGDKKAHGRVGHRTTATAHGGTDSSAEQSLEGELTAGNAQKGGCGNANPGGANSAVCKRQEGKGRGDTVRLWTSGILRGVGSGAGKGCAAWQQDGQTRNAANPTIGSGMQQARDSQALARVRVLRNDWRRKPAKWCETTRSERDFWHGKPEAEGGMETSGREWTPESMSMEGR